jgi:coenzyme F420-reducing hydrogenase delta subunit
MFNLSAAMAGGFVEATKEMTEKVTELGPNPLRKYARPSGSENPVS